MEYCILDLSSRKPKYDNEEFRSKWFRTDFDRMGFFHVHLNLSPLPLSNFAPAEMRESNLRTQV